MLARDVLGDVRFRETEDFQSLLEAVRAEPMPRLALLDIRTPGLQGGIRLRELSRRYPKTALIIVSVPASAEAMRCLRSIRSVQAVLPESASASRVRTTIATVIQGQRIPSTQTGRGPAAVLTPRQSEIRGLLYQGMSNKMIASTLGIAEGTVKNHITDIFRALKAANRTQVALSSFDGE
jgi:DNA-binding NarL/FixJ family response regulator